MSRCKVVELLPDNRRARFECLAAGHRFVRSLFGYKGQARFLRGNSAAARMMAHYWRDGVSMDCPVCLRARQVAS